MNRRRFLIGAAGAAAFVPSFSATLARAALTPARPRGYAACAADADGNFFAAGFSADGAPGFRIDLPERGHDIAFHPARAEAVVFSRRPGVTMHVVDIAAGGRAREIEARPDRHFYGHGVFTPDGRHMFVTENDFEAGRGVLGIYDTKGYRRIDEIPSHGVGPHQLRRMPDGRTLVIGNGGIRTHPDLGRAKLNVEDMKPSLAFVDSQTGRRLHAVRLPEPLHKLSIRHLDVNGAGTVAFGMQYEGDRRDRVPMIALVTGGAAPRLLKAPGGVDHMMRHYTGSTVFDSSGRYVAVSSPRGHVVGVWETRSADFVGNVKARDACGLAATGKTGEFLVTSGDGSIRLCDAPGLRTRELRAADRSVHWDNHIGVA